MKKKMLDLDLQLFADGEVEEPENTGNDGESTEFTAEQQEKINRLIAQAKSKAKDEAKADNQKAIEEAVAAAIEKERSYAEMSEKEKKDARLSEREQELAEREAAIAKKELQAEVKADVQDKGLPVELVDLLTQSDDKELILESVNAIKKIVDEAITEGIKANARQVTPTEPTREYGTGGNVSSIAEFANQQRIIKN